MQSFDQHLLSEMRKESTFGQFCDIPFDSKILQLSLLDFGVLFKEFSKPVFLIGSSFSLERRYFQKNLEPDQNTQNGYLKLISHLYETCDEYFHSSDVKVLIDILLRQLAMNRSCKLCFDLELNCFLILNLIKVLTDKFWWKKSNYRKNELVETIRQFEKIGNLEVQYLCSDLLLKI